MATAAEIAELHDSVPERDALREALRVYVVGRHLAEGRRPVRIDLDDLEVWDLTTGESVLRCTGDHAAFGAGLMQHAAGWIGHVEIEIELDRRLDRLIGDILYGPEAGAA